MQLQAAFILEAVYKSLKELYSGKDEERLLGLFQQLSYFDVEESKIREKVDVDPLVCVYSNMISRGLPTYSTIYLEKEFNREFQKTHLYRKGRGKEVAELKHTVSYLKHDFDEEFIRLMFRSLHVVDPRFSTEDVKRGDLMPSFEFGSDFERDFYYSVSAELIGKHAFQHLKGQICLETLLRFSPDEYGELDKIINGAIF